MKIFHFVRHGQTDWNRERRIQGQTDIPLNEIGKSQARQRAETLRDLPFELCLCSDLSRARQTAELLIQERTVPVQIDARLRERHHGSLEGLHCDAYDATCPKQKEQMVEPPSSVLERLSAVLNEVAHSEVLVVTHGGLMKILIHHLLPSLQQVIIPNGALLTVSWEAQTQSILSHDGIEFYAE